VKYILGMVLVIVAGTVVFLVQPRPTFKAGKPVPESPEPVAEFAEPPMADDLDEAMLDERRLAMEAEYEKLTRARRDLEQRLNRLKVLLWNVELPRAQSAAITEQMQNSYALLKNRRMLGAYSGPQEISEELARLEYAYENLDWIEETARLARERRTGETGDQTGSAATSPPS